MNGKEIFLFVSRSGNKVWQLGYKLCYINKETDITI